jgi:hypothetical protein
VLVVEPCEVQCGVDDEVGEVVVWAALGGGGFASQHAEGEHDLAGHSVAWWVVGEHVGWFVLAAVARVEAADRAVVGEQDGGGAVGGAGGACGDGLGAWDEPVPGRIRDDDAGRVWRRRGGATRA